MSTELGPKNKFYPKIINKKAAFGTKNQLEFNLEKLLNISPDFSTEFFKI